MSSILKALKKLEDDKIVRQPDDLKIDAEILRPDQSNRLSPLSGLLGALLLLAAGSGATYMYLTQKKSSLPGQITTAPFVQDNRPAISAAPDIKTEQLPPAIVVVPAVSNKTAAKETSAPRQQQKTPAAPVKQIITSKPAEPEVKPKPLPTQPAPVKNIPIPALRVNGIAMQNNAKDSVAIVNGIAVTGGSVIEGVTVVEIQRDRVLFNRNGERFEISLGQSNK